MAPVWPTILRFLSDQGAAVLVTLTDSQGPSPHTAGARMIVGPDGTFSGTVGGGALELLALTEARTLLGETEAPALRRIERAPGPAADLSCGGHATLLLERFSNADRPEIEVLADAERAGPIVLRARPVGGRLQREIISPTNLPIAPAPAFQRRDDGEIIERFGIAATPVLLFGAGHVGRALAPVLAPLPFVVTWADPRPEAFPPHLPTNIGCHGDPKPVHLIERAADGTFVAIMSHNHGLDLELATAALATDRFPYVGLIGSASKRASFATAMRKRAIPETSIDRLVCPIGLTEIRDRSPAAIAIGIAAQMLIVRDRINSADRASHSAPPPSVLHGGRHG